MLDGMAKDPQGIVKKPHATAQQYRQEKEPCLLM